MNKPSEPTTPKHSELADRLSTRGPVPECFIPAGVLIGITEGERDLIVEALRTFAQSETTRTVAPDETAWFVERPGHEWLAIIELGAPIWTKDPNKACRFPSREAANAAIGSPRPTRRLKGFEEAFASEHVFVNAAVAPSAGGETFTLEPLLRDIKYEIQRVMMGSGISISHFARLQERIEQALKAPPSATLATSCTYCQSAAIREGNAIARAEAAERMLKEARPYLDMIEHSLSKKRPLVMVVTKCDAEALAKRIDDLIGEKA